MLIMASMLDLAYAAFKFASILTLLRLTSTAFGWEFGISRQYLRLLELLFYVGQKRIEKVESEQKLIRSPTTSGSKGQRLADDEAHFSSQADHHDQASNSVGLDRGQSDSSLSLGSQRDEHYGATSNQILVERPNKLPPFSALGHTAANKKMRRISTPDGPPVFLLDYYEPDEGEPDRQEGNNYYVDSGDDENINIRRREFHLAEACAFVLSGVSAIVDDEVTKRFTPEELKTWNLLTRTNKAKNYQFMSRSLGLYWFLGFLVRYAILLPLRIMFTLAGFAWLTSTMALVGCLPKRLREQPYRLSCLMSFRMLSCGITSRLKFHNRQFRAKNGDICVANHTSPLDVVLLACDNCYALVGQRHGGLLGLLEHALSRASNHVWFDRGEMRDRQLVTKRLKQHVSSGTNLPVLIFPEGTCINNSAVMMFRKGSFETTDRVCPVAIKYDPRFGDPFWNSSKQSYIQYLLLMMSSWAIKCDVWYLPPMERLPGESSAEFANRVKAEIARQGGLVDLAWDGQLKRTAAKEVWKHQQQEDFVQRLKLE